MAHTAHQTAEEFVEHFDSPEELDRKITALASRIRASNHMIAFTGAGVSTATGIPDYRSGVNTALATGAGGWTIASEREHGREVDTSSRHRVAMLNAVPSLTHMALVELNRRGILKFLISQNTDGLHRRSGFDVECLSELHGNTNLERCMNCGKEYLRDYQVNGNMEDGHKTGNACQICGGPLKDTIINFGENLPENHMANGFNNADRADLCLAMGSSLKVVPAADMPKSVGEKGGRRKDTLFIVNLQATPLDGIATRVNGMCDTVMAKLMEKLGIPIPEWRLSRYVRLSREMDGSTLKFRVSSIDKDGTPVSLFKGVGLTLNPDDDAKTQSKFVEPFEFEFSVGDRDVNSNDILPVVDLTFFRHYGEPQLRVDFNRYRDDMSQDVVLNMLYDVRSGTWSEPTVDERVQGLVQDMIAIQSNFFESAEMTSETDTGGLAVAIHRCAHVHELTDIPEPNAWPNLQSNVCQVDGCDSTENWICLTCFAVLCGRYGNQHAIHHSHVENHPVVMNSGDLSFWCYDCNAYLHHLSLEHIFHVYESANIAKFGEAIPEGLRAQARF